MEEKNIFTEDEETEASILNEEDEEDKENEEDDYIEESILAKDDLKKQLKYFSFFEIAPIIIAGITALFFFIWAIVDPCVFGSDSYYSTTYGIMMLPSGFLCWFIWILIGAVVTVCTYVSLTIAFSHKILQIYYLQKISMIAEKEANKNNTQIVNESESEE